MLVLMLMISCEPGFKFSYDVQRLGSETLKLYFILILFSSFNTLKIYIDSSLIWRLASYSFKYLDNTSVHSFEVKIAMTDLKIFKD